jgi:hypothetical protein
MQGVTSGSPPANHGSPPPPPTRAPAVNIKTASHTQRGPQRPHLYIATSARLQLFAQTPILSLSSLRAASSAPPVQLRAVWQCGHDRVPVHRFRTWPGLAPSGPSPNDHRPPELRQKETETQESPKTLTSPSPLRNQLCRTWPLINKVSRPLLWTIACQLLCLRRCSPHPAASPFFCPLFAPGPRRPTIYIYAQRTPIVHTC